MKFGLSTFVAAETDNPGETAITPAELGVALEERGFESLFYAEHSHMPENSSPFPNGGEPPRFFYHLLDPLVSLTWAASVTTNLRIGTGIVLAAQHDPILLAKEAATLDLLSGGRLLFGIGAGWNLEEAANHGVNPRRRFTALRESMTAIRRIWTEEVVEFRGEHVSFGPLRSWPKPVQRPHPPVILGGWSPRTFQRVLDMADGWMARPEWSVTEAGPAAEQLRRMAREQGKPEPIVQFFLTSTDSGERERELDQALEYRPERLLFSLGALSRDETLRRLDEFAKVIDR